MLNEGQVVVAGVAALAGGVWVAVRATVVALIHPPVVSECAHCAWQSLIVDGQNQVKYMPVPVAHIPILTTLSGNIP